MQSRQMQPRCGYEYSHVKLLYVRVLPRLFVHVTNAVKTNFYKKTDDKLLRYLTGPVTHFNKEVISKWFMRSEFTL
jgi:hypothetical protein